MADHRAQVEDLLADYRRGRDQLAEVHRALAAINESATSPCGLVTATVSAQGGLTGLHLRDDAYRVYRPAELAAVIVRTTTAADALAARAAGHAVAPVLPSGTDPEALLRGTADLAPVDLVPPRPPVEEESFENVKWLESGRS
ncbi:YbaB/EbfC family nucleoid-associated protein [Actinokineospora auranticolor]|uniref:YbaB/EbfC DNA-binding family protein n=1 Tax=Actinokineospora auranticolor TaxID=155976 RepID=A0A2S6GX51_9PSEU|nr:YbaB/EbfC family nucleoid-associated protein [Actinokineospora auranticolor]PPK69778.1 YbaB/EbfC DNA-binding family protein [Actinokineospora auranticolor]